MAIYWEIAAHSAYDMFSLYEDRSESYKLLNIHSKTKRKSLILTLTDLL